MELRAADEALRDIVLIGAMSGHRAAAILNDIQPNRPWYRKSDYIAAIAAIAAAFPDEMNRKTYMQGRPMGRVLWSATSAGRLSWAWNTIVIRRRLPRKVQSLLGAGTAPNEALRAEINKWYKNQPEVRPETVGGGGICSYTHMKHIVSPSSSMASLT